VKFYNCGKFGPYASKCRAPSNDRVEENENYVEEQSKEGDPLLMTCMNDERRNNNKWYLDTGASNHMCGKKITLVELSESMNENAAFGDESMLEVKGRKYSYLFEEWWASIHLKCLLCAEYEK